MSSETGVRSPESGATKAPRWAWWVATGFGSGYLKPAPGTWGSLAALPVWILLFKGIKWICGGVPSGPLPYRLLAWEAPILLALLGYGLLAVKASGLVEAEAGTKDPGFIVADEWIGLGLALWPVRNTLAHWPTPVVSAPVWEAAFINGLFLVVPFGLFRLFDIWKPWPCKRLQNLGGGPGVVLDDVAAGLWAAVGTALLLPWF